MYPPYSLCLVSALSLPDGDDDDDDDDDNEDAAVRLFFPK